MVMRAPTINRRAMRGISMIEVLITVVILAVGLLGLAGLQLRLQASEMEAYQRAQALILLNDMASRLATNRANAAAYVVAADSPLGAGMDCTGAGELAAWCEALQGAGETSGNSSVGAMLGGRGCVEALPSDGLPGSLYLITVAWQGLTPVSAPPDGVACGQGLYDGGNGCANDRCRRTVTTIVRIADLAAP